MNLCKTIERYANAVSSFDHWHDSADKAQATEAAKKAVALRDRIDVLIAQAEAAERLAEAFEAAYVADGHACDDGAMDTAWKQYVAARDAVRKVEEGT